MTKEIEQTHGRIAIVLPDVGVSEATVVSLWVESGGSLAKNQSMLSIESDKTQLDVPSPYDGSDITWDVSEGDVVKQGQVLAHVSVTVVEEIVEKKEVSKKITPVPVQANAERSVVLSVYASPGVRRLARELDIDLTQIKGTGLKGRVTKNDVTQMNSEVTCTLSHVQMASMQHLTNAWQSIPHVTHGESCDITHLEEIRKSAKAEHQLRFSVLPFVVKAVSNALIEHPKFSSRLSADKTKLIKSTHDGINIAVDTPEGLRVPRLDDIASLSLKDLIHALTELGLQSRENRLSAGANAAGEITITSLGGVGGSWFTPIINAPQIAIVGVMRSNMTPVWTGDAWVPRLMLPVSLSYDHRAVDGVDAQKFLNCIKKHLQNLHQDPWVEL